MSLAQESDFCSYRELLLSHYRKRKERNPRYSVRAFARYLNVNKTTLSEVLAGSRHLSPVNARRIAEKLQFTEGQAQRLEQEISRGTTCSELSRYSLIDEPRFEEISEWYYLAILNYAKVENNSADIYAISGELGISVETASNALEKLCQIGLLKIENNRLVRTARWLHTQNEKSSASQRKYHLQNLELAAHSLRRDPPEVRDCNSITFAIDPKNIEKARQKILAFKREMGALLSRGEKSQVYTLAVQLFPARGNQCN